MTTETDTTAAADTADLIGRLWAAAAENTHYPFVSLMHEAADMLSAVTEIDWKAKFLKAVEQNVEQSGKHKAKVTEVGNELQDAKRQIAKLEADVRRMEPADEKRKRAEEAQIQTVDRYEARLREMRTARNQWRDVARRGQRGAIESVIEMLQKTASQMPAPLDSDLIDFQPASDPD